MADRAENRLTSTAADMELLLVDGRQRSVDHAPEKRYHTADQNGHMREDTASTNQGATSDDRPW